MSAVTSDRIFEIDRGKASPIDSKSEYAAALADLGN
jgi:hypothetical protein